ncbi:bifunctional folylpolyglutamate synthase/dihydrofolate synthase [Halanaerobacter jeridensis]|uniref:Dihydrofolate synthase/folylpolyglutamate synthase n=1 Tax=Halanaerobacter jeridensis TaxID=706427 RepID=A0A939BRM5_9FIRM|nr:folylpolyglutamate synthase/dihydrofolate synthase family protein [Halanaerobacter jeridensis]MBM7556161.1 dihydrofolate synthase/folylpolyglutamate synthase [Halanaerobacter jeridensis]
MQELDYLQQLDKFGVQPGLERMELLLDYLDNPEQDLDIIHIAGTNGKGSTSALLTSIYKEAGYKVGTYNSPEIVEFNERMRINEQYISDQKLSQLVKEVKPAIKEVEEQLAHPTFFEVVTAIAILYFAQENVDLAILEVGMGGVLDATNVGNSLVSVITNVSLDHTEYLGDTLTEIASEKGGIIKEGQAVITAATKEKVKDKLAEIAEEKKADLINIYDYFFWEEKETEGIKQQLDINGLRGYYKDLELPLLGEYQIINTVTALAVIEILYSEYAVDPEAIKQGISKVRWPGRLEVVSEKPMIILDGAHNQAGAQQLRKELEKLNYKRLIIVLSILEDKDYPGIIEQLAPLADELILTKNQNPRAAKIEELEKYARKYEASLRTERELEKAVDDAVDEATANDLILVGGSLYTVSEIRSRFV